MTIPKVYWHGVFPDFAKQGRVIRRGALRHEVLWDGRTEPVLVQVDCVKAVGQHKSCKCGRCGGTP